MKKQRIICRKGGREEARRMTRAIKHREEEQEGVFLRECAAIRIG